MSQISLAFTIHSYSQFSVYICNGHPYYFPVNPYFLFSLFTYPHIVNKFVNFLISLNKHTLVEGENLFVFGMNQRIAGKDRELYRCKVL